MQIIVLSFHLFSPSNYYFVCHSSIYRGPSWSCSYGSWIYNNLHFMYAISDLRQVGGFYWILRCPPPTKMTTTKVTLNTNTLTLQLTTSDNSFGIFRHTFLTRCSINLHTYRTGQQIMNICSKWKENWQFKKNKTFKQNSSLIVDYTMNLL